MKKHYTVIIIGSGPAGSAAAYTLAKHGIEACIVDKATFPRDKLCGGLLTMRSKKVFRQIFDESWDSTFEYKSGGIKFYYKDCLLNSVKDYSEIFFTRRIVFDDYLLRLAKEKGATSCQGVTATSIDLNKKTCYFKSGEEVSYDYLIGADGVNSIVAKSIFGQSFKKKTIAFALEIEVDKKQFNRTVTDPEIYFGIVRWGYGWIFPKKHTLTIGLGGMHTRNPEIKKEFNEFLISLFGEIPAGKIKGHYIPFGDYRKKPGLDNALLVGDAAGLVEPITGEGIAFAMQSGYFAALAIQESINSCEKAGAFKIYNKKLSEITSAIDHAKILRYLIFPKPSEYFFVKALPKAKRLPRKHLDLMAGDIKYGEYVRYLISRILKGITKRMLFIK